jgi:hypothetical protein
MRRILVGLGAVAAAVTLGCSGLMGFGTPVGTAPVSSGVPWSLSYSPATAEPHQLWIAYDLESTGGGTYRVSGDVSCAGPGGTETWALDLTDSGGPIVGQGMRKTIGTKEWNVGSDHSASGTIWGTELPGAPPGASVTCSGTWTAASNTTIRSLEAIVTD